MQPSIFTKNCLPCLGVTEYNASPLSLRTEYIPYPEESIALSPYTLIIAINPQAIKVAVMVSSVNNTGYDCSTSVLRTFQSPYQPIFNQKGLKLSFH